MISEPVYFSSFLISWDVMRNLGTVEAVNIGTWLLNKFLCNVFLLHIFTNSHSLANAPISHNNCGGQRPRYDSSRTHANLLQTTIPHFSHIHSHHLIDHIQLDLILANAIYTHTTHRSAESIYSVSFLLLIAKPWILTLWLLIQFLVTLSLILVLPHLCCFPDFCLHIDLDFTLWFQVVCKLSK